MSFIHQFWASACEVTDSTNTDATEKECNLGKEISAHPNTSCVSSNGCSITGIEEESMEEQLHSKEACEMVPESICVGLWGGQISSFSIK